MSELTLLYVPFPSLDEAKKLCHTLLKESLIACVNIHGPTSSLYYWENECHEDTEYIAIIKTNKKKEQEVINYIEEHHSYDIPSIICMNAHAGTNKFMKWLENSL